MNTKVCMLQTASGADYEEMLRLTSIPNNAYCQIHGLEYRDFIGIKRGYYDWQSTYNRTPMIDELMREGFDGWVLFVDADAYVRDLKFDIRSYLASLEPKICLVAAPGANTAPWDINAGVFLLNLGSENGRALVNDWSRREGLYTPDRHLKDTVEPWGYLPSGDIIINDQTMLHHAIVGLGLIDCLKIEKDLLNYAHGRFISQLIRSDSPTNQDRIDKLAKACAGVARSSEHLRPKNLTALANSYGTDKGTIVGNSHGYTRYYSFLFEQFRYDRFNALEIGLLRGGPEAGGTAGRATQGVPSIAMWLEYFPFAKFFGMDISDFKRFQNERFRFHQVDLTKLDDALALQRKIPKMKLVIEDASHASFHQQVAFAAFFPLVESGAYYVIEDCDWQPEHFEKELPKAKLTRDLFWEFMHFGLQEFPPEITERVDVRVLFDQISDVFVHRKETEEPRADVIKLFVIRKK